MDSATTQKTVRSTRIRLSVRYDYVIFPVASQDFREVLISAGFSLPLRTSSPLGVSIEPVGLVARRDQLTVVFEPDRQIVGVEGVNFVEVNEAFVEIEGLTSEKTRTDLAKRGRFLEIIGQFVVDTGENPLRALERLGKTSEIWSKFGSILGVPTAPFGLRIVRAGVEPNQEEWLEIVIEPTVVKATGEYTATVIFRSKDRSKVISFAERLEDTIPALVRTIELPPK